MWIQGLASRATGLRLLVVSGNTVGSPKPYVAGPKWGFAQKAKDRWKPEAFSSI